MVKKNNFIYNGGVEGEWGRERSRDGRVCIRFLTSSIPKHDFPSRFGRFGLDPKFDSQSQIQRGSLKCMQLRLLSSEPEITMKSVLLALLIVSGFAGCVLAGGDGSTDYCLIGAGPGGMLVVCTTQPG